MSQQTHIAVHTSAYTLCRWAWQVVEDMGHRVVSTTYHRECSTRERAAMNTCRECYRISRGD